MDSGEFIGRKNLLVLSVFLSHSCYWKEEIMASRVEHSRTRCHFYRMDSPTILRKQPRSLYYYLLACMQIHVLSTYIFIFDTYINTYIHTHTCIVFSRVEHTNMQHCFEYWTISIYRRYFIEFWGSWYDINPTILAILILKKSLNDADIRI